MNEQPFKAYRHSGKFGPHGPVLALVVAVGLGMPLGLAYAYLVKWIPFIYVNVFITAGYGLAFGFMTGFGMRLAKVRNTPIAVGTGLLAGLVALYFAWSGHVHTLWDEAPVVSPPGLIVAVMGALYEEGSWGLSQGGNVTGFPLVIVWLIEAGLIVGLAGFIPWSMIAETPFCEKNQCWLDEQKKIGTLAPFSDPAEIARLRQGDLGPLTQAKPRDPDAMAFARLTLKSSPASDEFCTVRVENVTLRREKDSKVKETVQILTRDLVLPRAMLDLIAKFERFGTPPSEPSEPAPEESRDKDAPA